jgi:hypothetical protein
MLDGMQESVKVVRVSEIRNDARPSHEIINDVCVRMSDRMSLCADQ